MRSLAVLAGFCNTSLTPAADDLISHLKSLLPFSPQAALKPSFILLLVPSLFLPPTHRPLLFHSLYCEQAARLFSDRDYTFREAKCMLAS